VDAKHVFRWSTTVVFVAMVSAGGLACDLGDETSTGVEEVDLGSDYSQNATCLPRCADDLVRVRQDYQACAASCFGGAEQCRRSCVASLGCVGRLRVDGYLYDITSRSAPVCDGSQGSRPGQPGSAGGGGTSSQDYPICSSCTLDLDRNGLGREANGQLCRSDRQCANYPTCSSCATDNDRDGWGYEGGSCLVGPECRNIPTCTACPGPPGRQTPYDYGLQNGRVCIIPQGC
jgi:hypothetical protein